MINTVTLVGRLTKEPTLQKTSGGNSIVSFNVAVGRNAPKQGQQEADFIQCVAIGKMAENLCQYQHKGNLIGIVGRIQTRNYENKDGQRVYVTEVVCREIQFLESRNQSDYQNQNTNYQQNNYSQNQSQYEPQSDVLDIDSDDLPF